MITADHVRAFEARVERDWNCAELRRQGLFTILRLAAAVDKALVDTVGPREAGIIYLRVAEAVPRSGLPRAQAVLSWLSSADDSTAQQVLSRAGALYATA